MIYIGIDPGMSVALAVQDENKRDLEFFTCHSAPIDQSPVKWVDEVLRLNVLRQRLHQRVGMIVQNSGVVVGIEHVSYGSVHRVARMSKVELVIQEVVLEYIKPDNIYMIAPNTMKKGVSGHGHTSKEMVRHRLKELYPACAGILDEDLNYSDALGVLHVAKIKSQEN